MSDPTFLQVAADYHLGMLDTERPHPLTSDLSTWAHQDLPRAIAALQKVDALALHQLEAKLSSLVPLAYEIHDTLLRGDRIFLCGCGATGRLSIALELFSRCGLVPAARQGKIIGFMAGGDAALIRSIERFEDLPSYGERQLLELGFSSDDLLIASTEGGETPFVIGATEAAAAHSSRRPFFLYGNPDDLLQRHVERSRRVLESPRIHKINLATGPMALTGSTRMQASTVLMAAIGLTLKHHADPLQIPQTFALWRDWVCHHLDASFLAPFIEAESHTCQSQDFVLYQPGPYGITVLTDTTERSPTFSLPPFERHGADEPPSLCYLHLPHTQNPSQAWRALLRRPLRPLEWGDLQHLTGAAALDSFDFSSPGRLLREQRCLPGKNHVFSLSRSRAGIHLRFQDLPHTLPVPTGIDRLFENLALKLLLNIHSTLVMGRLDRYEGNLMTFVSANNFKLIDRAVRYTLDLLERHHGWKPPYETVARQLLLERDHLPPGRPVVLQTLHALLLHRAELEGNLPA